MQIVAKRLFLLAVASAGVDLTEAGLCRDDSTQWLNSIAERAETEAEASGDSNGYLEHFPWLIHSFRAWQQLREAL